MKSFFVLISTIFVVFGPFTASASPMAPEIILDYSSGFQAGWSWLKIYADGSIEHQERICCPPHTNEVPEKSLDRDQLENLQALIKAVSRGHVSTQQNQQLGLGQKVGTLTVLLSGRKIIVKDVDRDLTNAGTISINSSPATEKLVNFLRPYVKNIILE